MFMAGSGERLSWRSTSEQQRMPCHGDVPYTGFSSAAMKTLGAAEFVCTQALVKSLAFARAQV
jgi:hypothetical protein